MTNRPSFPETYMNIAIEMSKRSIDSQTRVGCIATNKNNEMIGGSYNGFRAGYKPPFDITKEENRDKKLQLICHAEENILSRHEKGEIHRLYLTHSCCRNCAKLITLWDVKQVIFIEEYHREQDYKFILQEANVDFGQFDIESKRINWKFYTDGFVF